MQDLQSINTASETILLEMRNISKSFLGVQALKKAQLHVQPGTVHALMGENGAGKSTLMKCLFGIYHQDEGEILIKGKSVKFKNAKHALEAGVAMVHQELNLVRQSNVMDNLWLGRFPKGKYLTNEQKAYQKTQEIFKSLDIDIDPKEMVHKLSVSEMQMIEIAKAVSYHSNILVLDEPTSSLAENEVAHLFKIIDKLKAKGVGIIYISHKMEEILKISDDVTIMRDGQWIATESASSLDVDKIISLMVGRNLTQRFPPKTNEPSHTILKVSHLTSTHQPSLNDISFELRRGEILGIAGLMGSKRTEVLETLFGLRSYTTGDIQLNNRKILNRTPQQAISHGFALVTEERRHTGIFGLLDINFNATIANIKNYGAKWRFLQDKQMVSDTQWVIESMRVKTPNAKTAISTLSGGNQQKVIIGRWLLTKPEVLMLDEPTRGIDVGAKYEIYQLMIDLAKKDKGIIMVSSEMSELLGITDRIMVMSNGRLAGIVETSATTQEHIMALSAKYL